MLVAVARCKSSPPTYTRAGGSRTPPMPTQPARTPTSKAETSIKAIASVTPLTSPQTTRAKPCEHVSKVLLFTELPRASLLGNSTAKVG